MKNFFWCETWAKYVDDIQTFPNLENNAVE